MYGDIVYLRPIEETDLDYLNSWKNNEELFKYLGGGFKPTSKMEQNNWMLNMSMMNSNQRYIICEKTTDKPVGMIGLYAISLINRNAEIGMYIGDIGVRGKGYAKEALLLLENYSQRYLNLKKIKINVVKNNYSALNFWQKNNYIIKGNLVDERFIDGEYHDLLIMEKFLI